MRLVFFGTPEFAVPSLRALVGEGFDIAGVVTQPDRPRGRSRSKLVPPPIKRVALQEGLTVIQPEKPQGEDFIKQLEALRPELGVVVAYGHILRRAVLEVPDRGLINVHASLLPQFRGAAPIPHTILEGVPESGISIMQLDEGMDSGPVILRIPTPIAPDETSGELELRLSELGALGLIEALALMEIEEAEFEPQDDSQATYAPKLTHEDAHIDWCLSAPEISRVVRAFDPKPGAWAVLDGKILKCFGPHPADVPKGKVRPGEVVETDPAFVVATGDGEALQFIDVQLAGKPRMAAEAWVRGRPELLGTVLE